MVNLLFLFIKNIELISNGVFCDSYTVIVQDMKRL